MAEPAIADIPRRKFSPVRDLGNIDLGNQGDLDGGGSGDDDASGGDGGAFDPSSFLGGGDGFSGTAGDSGRGSGSDGGTRKRGRRTAAEIAADKAAGREPEKTKRPRNTLKGSEVMAGTLYGLHQMLKEYHPALEMPKPQADAMGGALAAWSDAMGFQPDPRVGATANLMAVAVAVYGPMIYQVRKDVLKKRSQAQ